jgi:acetyl esterase
MSGMTGRAYLERGHPVTVVTLFNARRALEITGDWFHFCWPGLSPAAGPRSVAIHRADGSTVVRPFRGLTRPTAQGPIPNPGDTNDVHAAITVPTTACDTRPDRRLAP